MLIYAKKAGKTKNRDSFKRIAVFLALIKCAVMMLSGCLAAETPALPVVSDFMPDPVVEITTLRVGVVSGPYQEMFEEAVRPSLEKMGYTIIYELYQDYESPNFALVRNEIDLNVFQHYAYLNTFKFENDLALSAVIEIPTVSMSIFSGQFNSVNEIMTGFSISIPDDASNLARALRVLEATNIISLDSSIDKSKATFSDIVSNPQDIRLVSIPAHELVDSLSIYDASVIPGNFAFSSGLDFSKALYRETLTENYQIVITVRTEDLNKQFVRDIIEVMHSDSFRDSITAPSGNYMSFQWPRWLHDIVDSMR